MRFKWQDTILSECDDYIVINKPPGLLSIPDREGKERSLKNLLLEEYGSIYTVHRLDRDTSGIILFAKNEPAHKFLSMQFEHRQTQKIYIGLVMGTLPEKVGSIDTPIAEHPGRRGQMITHKNGKQALTDFEVLDDFQLFSAVQFRIHTGRTHQIRVHAKHVGHPIACDKVYGDGKPILVSSLKRKFNLSKDQESETPILDRLGLHAIRLSFLDRAGIPQSFEAPMYKDMKATIQQLKKRAGT